MFLFSQLNGSNYHMCVNQIIILLQSKDVWVYFMKLLTTSNDDSDDLICLNKDEAHVMITLYIELDPIHHTKDKNGVK